MSRGRYIAAVCAAVAVGLFLGRDVFASALVARADQLFYGHGSLTDARRYINRALVFDPTYPQAAERLGLLAMRSKNAATLAFATTVVRRALRRAPNDNALRTQYAQLLFQQRRYLDSALTWDDLAKRDPATPLYRAWAAEAAAHAGDCPLELRYYRQMLIVNPSDRRSQRIVGQLSKREQKGQCA